MYDYCNLYKRKERYLVCDHTGMEPNLQRQIQSLQSILHNEEIQDKEIASVSYKYFYCKDNAKQPCGQMKQLTAEKTNDKINALKL